MVNRAGPGKMDGYIREEENMKNSDAKSEKENNPVLEDIIGRRARDGEISCAEAMQIAKQLGESTLSVGRMLDQMGIHLGECQLGLFGCINPRNRTVQAAQTVSPELEEEIRKALQRDCLSCTMAWFIAKERKITKMDVSASCECLKIKIKPCQFGTF